MFVRSLVQFALRRPRAAMAIWLIGVVALALVGRGVASHLKPTDLRVPGSSSAQARAIVDAQFGESATLPVLLTGPSRAVRSQGKALAARLQQTRGVTVVSPWNAGPGRAALRPAANRLLMLVSISGARERVDAVAREVRDVAHAGATGPVRAQVTGVPLAGQDVARASTDAIHRADLIALPVLLLILLCVFRSPMAAAIPVAFGASAVFASHGLLTLLTGWVDLDAFATGLASMVGLALAVDYSLLMVSRVREQRRAGASQRDAVEQAAGLSRHTVVVAGAAIVLAMVLTAALSPTRPMLSAAVGVCTVAIVAMLGAIFAIPAALMLAGDRIGTGRGASARRSVWAPVSAAVTRRPAIAGAAATALLLALALPALGLRTGAPDARELPGSSQARQDFEAIRSVSGPGWGAGFEIVSVANRGTMTTSKRLTALAELEATLRRDPGVRSVFGPGSIAKNAKALRSAGRALAREQRTLKRAVPKQARGLDRLAGSVDSASSGVDSLQGALGQAQAAAGKLGTGSDSAASGIAKLQTGLQQATAGERKLRAHLSKAGSGGQALGNGAGTARDGAHRIAGAINELATSAGRLQGLLSQLQARLQERAGALDGTASTARAQREALAAHLTSARRTLLTGKQTAQTIIALATLKKAQDTLAGADVAAAIDGTAAKLREDTQAVGGLAAVLPVAKARALAREAERLSDGITTLRDRLVRYGADVGKLAGGSAALSEAIGRLDGGSKSLATGISALRRGVGELESGVSAGKERSSALAAGLKNASGAVTGLRGSTPALNGGRAGGVSGGVIDSGYFVLAAIEGQGSADAGLNIAHGGEAARILVIPRTDVNSPATRALYTRLRAAADQFGATTETRTVVGGPAAMLVDYQQATTGRLLAVLLALSAATALLLMFALRAVLVPLVGVLLNAVCAAATLGIMQRLFGGDDPLLGGPGHFDATALTAVFAVMFALSIDYTMFIVSRIREELAAGAAVGAAIETGMLRTAGVVTGAALSMLAVFASFAIADVTSLRVFGVGLAVAVALDATIVRLVLLPALLGMLGRRAWWPMLAADAAESPAPAAPPRRVVVVSEPV